MKPVSLLKLNLLSCGALRKTDDDDNKLLLFGFLVARTGRGRQWTARCPSCSNKLHRQHSATDNRSAAQQSSSSPVLCATVRPELFLYQNRSISVSDISAHLGPWTTHACICNATETRHRGSVRRDRYDWTGLFVINETFRYTTSS